MAPVSSERADSCILPNGIELSKLTLKKRCVSTAPPPPPAQPPSRSRRARVRGGGSGWAHLEDVKRDPLTEPKQDRPTKTGMIQDMTPR